MSWSRLYRRLTDCKNTLEFELRRQEFIELVRRNQIVDAIAFAQRNLAPHRVFQQKEVDQVCALLCYKEGTTTEPYKVSIDQPKRPKPVA